MGESDSPPAQELLSTWPDLCAKYDIPCSAIHLSSGYTVGDDGNRYVFGSCEKRYPDFAEMVRGLHRRGIKVVPNIKPCKPLFLFTNLDIRVINGFLLLMTRRPAITPRLPSFAKGRSTVLRPIHRVSSHNAHLEFRRGSHFGRELGGYDSSGRKEMVV
jgi:hypothetical protein